jgi:hypothetical protein
MAKSNGLTLDVLAERIAALDRLLQSSLQSAQDAISKAESAQEKRFEGVNEFRAALADQAASFVTKVELDAGRAASQKDRADLRNVYNELRVGQRDMVDRHEMDTAIDALTAQVTYLQGAVNRLLITLLTSLVIALVTALLFAVFRA